MKPGSFFIRWFQKSSIGKGIRFMNRSDILLSVSMLISGREEMKKSLESLLYFKHAFPTEIILVDTGCNPAQRALAEEYADKIIDFVWCNDFAAARNAGLKEACGEWFLYLDDDEWFENPQEIIHFFTSGEYKEYRCASYAVRNYDNFQGTMYEDSYPARMVRLEQETRFVGRIHEYLTPFRMPKKEFHDYVHHYGYVYKNAEEKKAHAKRNFALLHDMVKENPGEPRWSCQLAQEYYAAKEYEETVQCCKDGLRELEKRKWIEYAPAHVGALYGYLLFSLEQLKRYEEEEKWLETAFADSRMNYWFMKPTLAFFCQAAARLFGNMEQYERCAEYLRKYFLAVKEFGENRKALEDGTAAITAAVFQDVILYGVSLMSMESVIHVQDHELAEEAFYRIDWSRRILLHQNKWEQKMLDACCSVPYHPLWSRILQTLVSREDGIKEMYVVFLETELAYKEQGEAEKLSRLYRLTAELDYKHRYISERRILWLERDPDIASEPVRRQLLEAAFADLVAQYGDELFEIKAEIWRVAEKWEISPEGKLLQTDYRKWKALTERWCREASMEKLREWDARISGWKRSEDVRYAYYFLRSGEAALRRYAETGPQEAGDADRPEQLLWEYGERVLTYYGKIYRETVFEESPEILPDEAQLALELKKLRRDREEGNVKAVLRRLRTCLGKCPDMEPVISCYAKQLREEIARQEQEKETARTELADVVQRLKLLAMQQTQQGEYRAAEGILLQIAQCMPEDTEVQRMLEELRQQEEEGALRNE